MMQQMKNILDLRFIIGAFFSVIGIVLVIYALAIAHTGCEINVYGGLAYLIFGVLMLWLWHFFPSRIQR
jgi:hypothetical protein